MPASGAAVVQSIRLEGRTLTVTMADGSEKSFTTQDTTSLPAMTGVLGTEPVSYTHLTLPTNSRV